MIQVIRALDSYWKYRDGTLVGEESPSWKLGEEITEAEKASAEFADQNDPLGKLLLQEAAAERITR